MALWSKKNELDAYDSDGYYEETAPKAVPETPAPSSPVGLSLGGNNIELKVVRPESYQEVSTVADYLLQGCTVFLNLEATDKDISRRILDFLSGVSYARGGNMKRVAASTYIVSPNNVDVSESSQEN
jgi:cell division inhibitor SepF